LPVSLGGVAKSFGERRVLEGLDLEIPAGQFLAIVGRSGGGKTTIMRLLAGLDAATAGSILIDGKPVLGLRPEVRLLFQDARLLPWQTVIGNVGIARAASASAWPWRAPWSQGPACCSSTNPSARSTR
jgi:sulfonate transport system ATP-binding protein